MLRDVRCCCVFCYLLFFLFKQKTAYEMRISDWSSDVCSSDLLGSLGVDHGHQGIVLVGYVEPAVIGVQGELLRVFAGGQFLDDLAGGDVHHLDPVRITGADVQQAVVVGQQQASGALSNRQGFDDLQALHVDQAQAVVFLVVDPGDTGGGGRSEEHTSELQS